MMTKIINDYINIEKSDALFTQALIEIENYKYENAMTFLEELLKTSDNIEQRIGVLFLISICQTKDDLATDTFLKIIYNEL